MKTSTTIAARPADRPAVQRRRENLGGPYASFRGLGALRGDSAAVAEAYRFTPGQYLTLKTEHEGEELRRSYSICSGLDDGELRVAVKKIAGGRFSGLLGEAIRPGQTLEVMTPMGRLYLNRIREAVGIDPKTGAVNAATPVDAAAVDAAIASGQPAILAAIGIGGLLILFYLMIAKPF